MTPPPSRAQAAALDRYYTRPETAVLCLEHLHATLPDLAADLYLEPAAGDGVFLSRLPAPCRGLDIAPAADGIETADFLTWTPEEDAGRIVVVGNPPFGRNAAKAITFFNHGARFADTIAMILPASLSKPSLQARLDRRFHLVSEMPLPREPFRHEGAITRVNTVFQVWTRRDRERAVPACPRSHPDFVFVDTLAEADFVMRRVGARAGTILPVPAEAASPGGYAATSNLFIRATGDPALLETRFRCLDMAEVRERVAACPSVSKADIVALYTAQLALERACAATGERPPVTNCLSPAGGSGVAATLAAPADAQMGDLVAMIVVQRPSDDRQAPSGLDVTFRRRDETGFAPVLRGALRRK